MNPACKRVFVEAFNLVRADFRYIFATLNYEILTTMKNPGKKKSTVLKTPAIDQGENEKYLKKLEIQKAVIKKIMDPITKQLQIDELNEGKNKVKRK